LWFFSLSLSSLLKSDFFPLIINLLLVVDDERIQL
jgi:hypothetical protein